MSDDDLLLVTSLDTVFVGSAFDSDGVSWMELVVDHVYVSSSSEFVVVMLGDPSVLVIVSDTDSAPVTVVLTVAVVVDDA